MDALFFNQHGDTSQLQFGSLPTPSPQPGEVLVRVRACALNRLDLWVLAGWPGLKLPLPHIGGSDIAGSVEELAEGVSGLAKGDRVLVVPGYATVEDEWTRRGEDSVSPGYRIFGEQLPGGFAEFICVPAKTLVRIPAGFDDASAAAIPLVGVTSWRMLVARASLQRGETLLVVGAGGGVNSVAIQIGKLLGARVIVVASSTEKAERARALGADETIVRSERPDWAKRARELTGNRGVDVVVDNVGKATIPDSLRALCRGGRLVTVGNTTGFDLQLDNRLVFGKQLSILGSTMGSRADFDHMIGHVWSGALKPIISETLPLADGRRGYELLERGDHFGKVILLP